MLFPRPLVLLLLTWTVVYGLMPVDEVDRRMVQKTQYYQYHLHARQFVPYRLLPQTTTMDYYSHVPGFYLKALELAHDGSKYVDTFTNPFLARPTKNVYFYSIIHPQTNLGREMKLDRDNAVASILWKYNANQDWTDIVHIDRIKTGIRGIDWDLNKLEHIIPHSA